MLTVIRTNDGRLLITDKNEISAVIKEAQEDRVDINDWDDIQNGICDFDPFETEHSYLLIGQTFDIDEACRKNGC
jgi:hypothetical protein